MTYKLIQREPTEEMIRAACLAQSAQKHPTYEDWRASGCSSAVEKIRSLVIADHYAMWDAAPQVDGYKLPDGFHDWAMEAIGTISLKDWNAGVAMADKLNALIAQSQPAEQSRAAQEAKDAAQPDWETFAARVLQASRENLSDVDGGDIQDWAVECGLLVAQMQTETCGEECRCVEYGMDLPWECFRYTPEAAEVVAALSQSAKEIKG